MCCSFCQFLKTVVYKNPEQAQLGGVPGTYNLVLSYLRLLLPPSTVTAEVCTAWCHFGSVGVIQVKCF